jgi:hypothetical protein
MREGLARLFVQIADSDSSGEDSIVLSRRGSAGVDMPWARDAYGMARRHGSGSLSGEVVELNGRDTLVDTSNHTLRDLRRRESAFPFPLPRRASEAEPTSMGSR